MYKYPDSMSGIMIRIAILLKSLTNKYFFYCRILITNINPFLTTLLTLLLYRGPINQNQLQFSYRIFMNLKTLLKKRSLPCPNNYHYFKESPVSFLLN